MWLSDKAAAAIKPLTDDCRKVDEVNMQLEQQQKSYGLYKANPASHVGIDK